MHNTITNDVLNNGIYKINAKNAITHGPSCVSFPGSITNILRQLFDYKYKIKSILRSKQIQVYTKYILLRCTVHCTKNQTYITEIHTTN